MRLHAQESVSSRLVLQHLHPAPEERLAYFHPDSSVTVIAAAQAAGSGAVLATHRRWPDAEAIRIRAAAVGAERVTVRHEHGAHGPNEVGRFDTVVVRLTPERLPFHLLLHDAWQLLRVGGRCLVVGGNQEGVKPALKAMEHVFGASRVVAHGGGHRLLESRKLASHDFSAAEALVAPYGDRDHMRRELLELRGANITMCSRPGVFSWEHLDEASHQIAEALTVSKGERVLDLGCGAGVLGAVSAHLSAGGATTLVDADCEAVRCARETMASSGLSHWRVFASDGTSAVAAERFDVVVSNPPFHVGKSTDLALPVRFMEEAWRVLDPGGRLVMVANRTLPYERELDRIFGNRRTISDGARFKVLEAVRR